MTLGAARKGTRNLGRCALSSGKVRRYDRHELKIWDRFWELDEGEGMEHKNWDTEMSREGRGRESGQRLCHEIWDKARTASF
jgi:hypothetical protein